MKQNHGYNQGDGEFLLINSLINFIITHYARAYQS